MKAVPVFCVLALSTMALQAQNTPSSPKERPVSFLLGMGLTFGGDKIQQAVFTDGSTQDLSAGGLVYFKGGCDWNINPKFSAQVSAGYHGNNVSAKNGDMRFERSFIEGLGHYNVAKNHRFGLGLRKSMGAKYTASGQAVVLNITKMTYTSAIGPVFEYEFFSKNGPTGYGISARYVVDKYKGDNAYGNPAYYPKDLNGNHFGIGLSFYL